MNKNTVALLALASCITAACRTTSSPPPLPASLLACGKIPDAMARVQCYDTQIAAITSPGSATAVLAAAPARGAPPAPAASAPAMLPAPAPPPAHAAPPVVAAVTPAPPSPAATSGATAPEPSAEAKFGQETMPQRSRPARTPKESLLVSKITDVLEVRHELFIITLENGQVWRQEGEGAQITRFFHAGDDVRIEKGLLGAYHMSTAATGGKNWVAVTRIR